MRTLRSSVSTTPRWASSRTTTSGWRPRSTPSRTTARRCPGQNSSTKEAPRRACRRRNVSPCKKGNGERTRPTKNTPHPPQSMKSALYISNFAWVTPPLFFFLYIIELGNFLSLGIGPLFCFCPPFFFFFFFHSLAHLSAPSHCNGTGLRPLITCQLVCI